MRQALHLIEMPKQFHSQILTAYHVAGRLLMKKKKKSSSLAQVSGREILKVLLECHKQRARLLWALPERYLGWGLESSLPGQHPHWSGQAADQLHLPYF